MNAADLQRLALAKRAYQATQPGETEIQVGVRRARLALRSNKRRRSWFSKGLVLVTLAVGSLAYAKPHALAELVEQLAPRSAAPLAQRGPHGGAAVITPPEMTALGGVLSRSAGQRTTLLSQEPGPPLDDSAAIAPIAALEPVAPTAAIEPQAGATPELPSTTGALTTVAMTTTSRHPVTAHPASRAASSADKLARSQRDAASRATSERSGAGQVSDWGRVGQALARGDETQALSALRELSSSNDQATRNKADLGLAQLLLAHGNTDNACALARSLARRHAGNHIERQAEALLRNCTR